MINYNEISYLTKQVQLQAEIGRLRKQNEHLKKEVSDTRILKQQIAAMQNDIKHLKQLLKQDLPNSDVRECIDFAMQQIWPLYNHELILRKTRISDIVRLRHIWIKLMRTYSGLSLVAIGNILGKDHSTILHACKSIDDLYSWDKTFRKQFDACVSIFNLRYQV